MTFLDGCRGAWRISGIPGSTWNAPPVIGSGNGVWLYWACEQFGGCDTPNGYNAGTCCNAPGQTCDHTDGELDCPSKAGALVTFCGDGTADYFIAFIDEPGKFRSHVSTVFASSNTVVTIVPVSVDAPPADGDSPEGVVSLTDEEVVLEEGDHNVWLEFRTGDWDPEDTGKQLAAWQFAFEARSYTTGLQGELAPYIGPRCAFCSESGEECFVDSECPAGQTCEPDHSICIDELGPGSTCGNIATGNYSGGAYYLGANRCIFAFMDQDRPDFVFANAGAPIVVADLGQPAIRVAGTVIFGAPDDPEPFPEGGLYSATMTLHVPSNAKGTFTVSLRYFPASQLVDHESQFVPLIEFRPAKITVQTGRCCYEGGCLDTLMSAVSCAQMPGFAVFTPNASCEDVDPCPLHDLRKAPKNRYLTIAAGAPGRNQAIRVTFSDLAPPHDIHNGKSLWVAEPEDVTENGHATGPDIPGFPNFKAATLQCDPLFMDWGAIGTIEVYHTNIVPDSFFDVEVFDEDDLITAVSSTPTTTCQWGDLVGGFDAEGQFWTAADGRVDVTSDVLSMVAAFQSAPGFPRKVRTDVQPATPDLKVDILDILFVVKAFQGLPYPFDVEPWPCP